MDKKGDYYSISMTTINDGLAEGEFIKRITESVSITINPEIWVEFGVCDANNEEYWRDEEILLNGSDAGVICESGALQIASSEDTKIWNCHYPDLYEWFSTTEPQKVQGEYYGVKSEKVNIIFHINRTIKS